MTYEELNALVSASLKPITRALLTAPLEAHAPMATEHARKHERPFSWLDTRKVNVGVRHFYPFDD